MTTKVKVIFREAQKWVTSETEFSSDEMDADEVLKNAEALAYKAQERSAAMTMNKVR